MNKVSTLSFLLVFMVFQVQAQFSAGNLVALRVTPNPGAFGQTGTAVTLLEYTTSGTATGLGVAIPTTTAGNRLKLAGNASYDGQMNLTGDGRYLCFGGYDVAAYTTYSTVIQSTKVIALVGKNGGVDLSTRIPTTTALNGAGAGSSIRCVVSQDGSSFWVASGTADATPSGNGAQYVVKGATAATTQVSLTRFQSLGIFGNKLYGSNFGLKDFGGLPTTLTTETNVGTSGAGNATQFVLLDLDPTRGWNGTPYDVLYSADATSGTNVGLGIRKSHVNFAGTSWILDDVYDLGGGTAIPALTGAVEGGKAVLYAIKGNNENNEIVKMVDNSARDMAMSTAAPTVTSLATAGAALFFRGIAFAPSADITIPVELVSFKGTLLQDKAVLQWVTASEVNVKEFIVEKSNNAKEFEAIGTIAAKNKNNQSIYDFNDVELKENVNYYRLKMMDNDGTFKYSNVVAIKLDGKTASGFGIFPNPATQQVTLNHIAAKEGAVVKIVSITGSIIAQYPVVKDAIQTRIDVSQLSSGQYFIHYTSKGFSFSSSFVK